MTLILLFAIIIIGAAAIISVIIYNRRRGVNSGKPCCPCFPNKMRKGHKQINDVKNQEDDLRGLRRAKSRQKPLWDVKVDGQGKTKVGMIESNFKAVTYLVPRDGLK